MNYKDWRSQYYVQEIKLKKYIRKLKDQAKVASPSDSNDINYRIALLYSMYLEVKHTGKYISGMERREKNDK